MVRLRPAEPTDEAAIRDLLLAAFPADVEAGLVEQLRDDGDLLLEWVAQDDEGRIVGAVHYSLLMLRRDGEAEEGRAAALGPVAVLPSHQKQGIGGRLIGVTVETLRLDPWMDAIVVLGHPEYYPRFGFSHEVALARLIDPFDAGAAFMAMALKPEALDAPRARPIYPEAFGVEDKPAG